MWTPTSTTEGLITDAVQKSTPASGIKAQYDVIVIGAGFAGLIAARDLSQKHNLNVLLIEARDRIGGRTWTAKVLDEEIEMGGLGCIGSSLIFMRSFVGTICTAISRHPQG